MLFCSLIFINLSFLTISLKSHGCSFELPIHFFEWDLGNFEAKTFFYKWEKIENKFRSDNYVRLPLSGLLHFSFSYTFNNRTHLLKSHLLQKRVSRFTIKVNDNHNYRKVLEKSNIKYKLKEIKVEREVVFSPTLHHGSSRGDCSSSPSCSLLRDTRRRGGGVALSLQPINR